MAMRGPFTEAVERITGRQVIAFMSQSHLDPDMCAEIFVLAPNGDGPLSDRLPGESGEGDAESA